MDWIHCNKCFVQLEPGVTLHLTSCGHMFCNNCLDNNVKEITCLICRVPCSIMKLVPDMNPEIQDYFSEPEELIKKSCEVLQFQRQHRRRLLSYLLQSTKKFYTARNELRRMSEICQKQHKQLKECQKVIKGLQAQLSNQSSCKQISPFSMPISPNDNISPSFVQSTPSYKRPAKSTPYGQQYQSNLVTPTRISKQRSATFSGQSQRSSTSNKISSTVFTPPTPESAGCNGKGVLLKGGESSHKTEQLSQRNPLNLSISSDESGFYSNSPMVQLNNASSSVLYCNGVESKCSFRTKKKTPKNSSYD